jgi:RNA polymerase sigma-70 factor (ECF subfamily)
VTAELLPVLRKSAMTDDDLLALYERTVEDLYRYASRLTGGDRAWADELVQDTYLAVLQRIRAGLAEPVDIGWLVVACRHRFLDQLKQQRRSRARERRSATPEMIDQSACAAIDALAEVPDEHRAALVLRYVDDLTVNDVARALDRSVRATESLLVRARASLRLVLVQGAN